MDSKERSVKGTIHGFFLKAFIVQKLHNPAGYLFLAFVTILLASIMVFGGLKAFAVLMVCILGPPCLYLFLFNLKAGLITALVFSYLLMGIKRLEGSLPLGVFMDMVTALMLFGLFLKQYKNKDWGFAKNSVTYIILIWILYNFLELFNPWAPSRVAWFYTVRKMAGLMALYFIGIYVIDNLAYISLIIKTWIGLSLLAALYGLFQEYAGLRQFELNWLMEDELRYHLLFQWGRFRKFSFLADPTVFGILMAYSGTFCLVLMFGPFGPAKKVFLGISAVIMFLSMVYSGTRTGYAMIPAGILFFSVITLKRKILVVGALFAVILAAIILVPTSNPHIYRIKSAFLLDKSSSYQARLTNQEKIQPYIHTHPIGFGLGSTGDWGRRFSPGHFLADFPPDSGYVRVAVELGWIGLFIYCLLLFIVLREGIKNYFSSRNKLVRVYYTAFLTMLYMLIIADFPQQALTQFPTNLMFFTAIAVIVRLKSINNKLQLENDETINASALGAGFKKAIC